jgi:hypothetical protein
VMMQVFSTEPGTKGFQMLCHEMYKRFGACYTNLKVICQTEADRQLLVTQLHELRSAVRELLEKARQT